MKHIVKIWAGEVLYFSGDNRYLLEKTDGEPIGEIIAASDEEAIQKSAGESREFWKKAKDVGTGRQG